MNIDFLQNEILPKRALEIKEGKNLCTAKPIYVVLDLVENICSGHSDYSLEPNEQGKKPEFGFIDNALDSEDRKFSETDEGMTDPEEVTIFYTDRFVAFFLTSERAHNYLTYQGHNLHDAYVYVFGAGYSNWEMDNLFSDEN